MKRRIAAAVVAAVLAFGGQAWAAGVQGISDEYDDDITHPLHLAYYLAHPIGYAAEWLVGRPFHYVVSRPYLNEFFGYEPFDEQRAVFDTN